MTRMNTQTLVIPEEMLSSWQTIVDLLADILQVPAALIMRIHEHEIEVFCANNHPEHQTYHPGARETLGHGLYCETVINQGTELTVANALADAHWRHNPDIALGMIAYCGIPLLWPNGETFGTICVLDNKQNYFSPTYRQLLYCFRSAVESQLTVVFQHHKLQLLNDELQLRIETRTRDLAELNYALNQEIDKRKAAEQMVAFQRHHDPRTEFLNLTGLEHELHNALHKQGQQVALLYVGIANARHLQSRLGYQGWEQVLKLYRDKVGQSEGITLDTARTTSTDLVFMLTAPQLNPALDNLCQRLIMIHQSEFQLERERFHLDACIGLATSQDSQQSDELIHLAAQAMQFCKDSGFAFHYHTTQHRDDSAIDGYLMQALKNEDLTLYVQPIVEPGSRRWTAAQATLRGSHPQLGEVTHEALLNMAEQNGTTFEVSQYLLRHTIELASRWNKLFPALKLTTLISPAQLQNGQLAQQIEAMLNAHDVSPAQLAVEVNDRALLNDNVVVRNTLQALHDLGVGLTLSEFGSGVVSFHQLQDYRFDAIKLDGRFVQQLTHDNEDQEILRSVIQVAHKLHLHVIADGVENPQQDTFFAGQECHAAQGYLYGPPIPTEEFELIMLNQHHSFAVLETGINPSYK